MWESYFGFKKTPFSDCPDAKQLFASAAWQQVKTRFEFLTKHPGAGLLTGEVGAGKSTAARVSATSLNPSLYKILYVHFATGSALDLLRQIALTLDLEPAHFRGDLVRQISDAIVRLNQSKKQHPILICDEAHLLPYPALDQLPLLLNFDMDSSRYLTLLLIGQPLLRRTLSLQIHEALRQRIGVHYHLEGLTREELDAYLTQQLSPATCDTLIEHRSQVPSMNRRVFLQTSLAAPLAAAGRQPNIVFVLTDQWRAQAFGYTGDPNAHTPAIDALVSESVNFRNAVSGFPVCSPYRGSLMTGQYAVRNGLVVNDVPLRPNGPTLGETFRKAGYRTGYIGKWHIFGSPDGKYGRRLAYIPKESRFGFEYWKTCECTHNYNHSLYYDDDNTEPRYWLGYDAAAQTRDACEFIRQQSGASDPYFLLLSLGPPHDPYGTAPESYRAPYAKREIKLRPNVPEAHVPKALEDLRGYYAHIQVLDDCVARIKEAVAGSGAAEDTIFIFAADHGAMLQSQGLHHKQVPWDESIRVPFLVRYPRRLGRKRRDLTTLLDAPDIMPTLLGLAGLRVPESVQGQDFSSIATGEKREEPDPAALLNLPASFSVIRRFGMAEYRGLRTLRHTYVRSIYGPWLLYDNEADAYQKHNLIGNSRYRDVQAALDRRLDARLKAAGDEFLPGARYIERAHAQHYLEVNVEPGHVKSPWGDWESNWR